MNIFQNLLMFMMLGLDLIISRLKQILKQRISKLQKEDINIQNLFMICNFKSICNKKD